MNFAQPSSVLIVDDEAGIRTALRVNFARNGWTVETASGVTEAARLLESKEFHLVVSDMRMPDGNGLEVMRSARKVSPSTAVILLTAFGSVPDAVQAMRGGAFDYLTKPVSFEQLEEAAARVMQPVKDAIRPDTSDTGSIVGRAPQLLRAISRARAASSTDADVLVEAESGTGKELLARFIHEASNRARKPFIAVNCAAVPEHLLESELFGHARGAFTGATTAKPGKFELANGGTLLLDEIGEMPLNLQPKLLRALQEREFERLGETRSIKVDIRVIATTNVNLASMVDEGKFRSDLYYRLNVIPLSIPALKDRAGDIELLANYFVEKFAAKLGGPAPRLSAEFVDRLNAHNWPGNVRELGNFMRRVCSLHPSVLLDADCFDQEFQTRTKAIPAAASAPLVIAGAPIRQLERVHLENTLAMTQGNRTQAAEMLGISIRTMRNRIREYGLPPRRYA
ncbi:sigma-54-dependent transcriptional regulator [Granulicella tundricola]|uniref:Two component, sigma54 specific, transcriptional regulator, Fis family n=1 Tax=Granulicella tundricola (strain ATCC BAA-1859 / DSM 23138 / MP5ACTX9) TaxID=1198114 RepID=E8X647_GRATM|nr:sigma-54 dependent transcriptional regulator [Granulicella tundricola]ADW70931.1 two component, sigma54 specific, transcriptional regulator, Fis family [Granulicella tundricola MP5ACTX9]